VNPSLLTECEAFCKSLWSNDTPRDYVVKSRGLSEATAKDLMIGYCDHDTSDSLGIDLRGRITFPIKDVNGDILGFGGRLVEDGVPKYINPSASAYDKSGTLYNLDIARDYILDSGLAIVMEGYTDVASLWDAGIKNVVATCGTAMSRKQLRLLKRFADEVVIMYDDDSSGNNSSERVLQALSIEKFPVYIANGLAGMDPDEYIRLMGVDSILEVIYEAKTKKR